MIAGAPQSGGAPSPSQEDEAPLTALARLRQRAPAWVWWSLPPLGLMTIFAIGGWSAGMEFPADVGRDVGQEIDEWIDWIQTNFAWLFDAITEALRWCLLRLRDLLTWLPWPSVVVGIGILCWRVVGWRLGVLAAAALTTLGFMGLWESTMQTVTLVIVTVAASILLAVPLGVWASQSDRVFAIIRPILDGMQTMPSFVYLVPTIALFGLGEVPGVLASLIYAVPPAVRLTNLGIRQLPADTIEAAESFGMTRSQMLLKVKIPLAVPTIMAGINQTTLAALAMVVIASLVGARGLGEDVLRGLGRLESGNAILAGLGIVTLAIIIDRLTQAFASNRDASSPGPRLPAL